MSPRFLVGMFQAGSIGVSENAINDACNALSRLELGSLWKKPVCLLLFFGLERVHFEDLCKADKPCRGF